MIPLTTKGAGADAISSVVHTLVNQSFEDLANKRSYPDWGFNVYEMESTDEQYNGVSAPTGSRKTIEGEQYGTGTRYRDYPTSFSTLAKSTIELSVTEELRHWTNKKSMVNTVRRIKNWADESVLSLQFDVDFDVAKLAYLGFGTTYFTGGDGLSVFNSSHTIRAGGTQSNMFATADGHLAFGADALDKAISIMNRFQGPNGRQLLPCRRLRVLCSTELESKVIRTLYSEYGPDTPNLGQNIVGPRVVSRRGASIDYAVLHHMPAAYKDYWFLVDLDRGRERLTLGVGWEPRVEFDDDLRKGIPVAALGSVYYSPIIHGFQAIFGSKGDASSTA